MMKALPIVAALIVATFIVIALWPARPDPVCEYMAEQLRVAATRGIEAGELRTAHAERCDAKERLRNR